MKKVNIKVLEKFFDETDLPNTDIRLNQCSVIKDPKVFVESHLSVLRANSGKKLVMPYYERLLKFYYIIKDNKDENKNSRHAI